MTLSKAYDKLTDNPEFSDGLTISTGQTIDDGDGVNRINIQSNGTFILSEVDANSPRIDIRDDFGITARVNAGNHFRIDDTEGNFDALRYITSASAPGTLELTNADLDIFDRFTHKIDTSEEYDPTPSDWRDNSSSIKHVIENDSSNTAGHYVGMRLQATGEQYGFVDLIAEQIDSENGAFAVRVRDNYYYAPEVFRATADIFRINEVDLMMGDSSTQSGNEVKWPDGNSSQSPLIRSNNDQELTAEDGEGNATQLT